MLKVLRNKQIGDGIAHTEDSFAASPNREGRLIGFLTGGGGLARLLLGENARTV